ncbi:response regulator transcription factor [Pseudoxanthomonas sp. PXM01]|uniref:response regulator transcription factor n=1 Tax=Pseudoxanthomonas sp. PXM01 TaxID=2769295 RepID=UPI001785C56A|nr:response regulator transcription factor [Pseudoxanthomonas sp. PXM01]MBD9469633.1 response regulator transcription factor [Pseudoxanthomonas sp. PXM01]
MMTQSPLPTVLLVEDDAVLRDRVLIPRLSEYGFSVTGVETVRELYRQAAMMLPPIVVLDVGLPDGDGFSAARWLRSAFPTTGIVMLTGRGDVPDHVRGLNEGADAYLAKPVAPELLAATLHSLARRLQLTATGKVGAPVARWHLDAEGWCLVSPDQRRLALTRSERKVLVRLMAGAGTVVTRDQLIESMTDNIHDFDPHRLDSLIHRLRRKVQEACGLSLPLTSVHGEGYMITP